MPTFAKTKALIIVDGQRPKKSEERAWGLTVETALDALEDADAALDGRLDTAEGAITSLDGRLDAAETALDALEGAASALDGRLDTAETALGGKADKTTTISGGGLATGGGDLSANRTITVPAASGAEAIAGTLTTKAMTPAADKAALDAALTPIQAALPTLADPLWLWAVTDNQNQVILGRNEFLKETYIHGRARHALLPDVLHVAYRGQSNGGGAYSLPVVTENDPGFGNWRFSRGLITRPQGEGIEATPNIRPAEDFLPSPLTEAAQFNIYGETGASGLASHFKAAMAGGRYAQLDLTRRAPHVLASYSDWGGKLIVELGAENYETNPSTNRPGLGGYHNTFKDDMAKAKTIATNFGLSYGVGAIVFRQGESEDGGLIYPEQAPLSWSAFQTAYRTKVTDFAGACITEAVIASGNVRGCPFLITQVQSEWSGPAQAAAARGSANIFLVGPNYYAPSSINSLYATTVRGDVYHLTADGQRWLGEQEGKVLKRILLDGEDWRPVEPTSVTRIDDTTIRVQFYVPRPPLRWDTTNLPAHPTRGFQVFLGTFAGNAATPGTPRTIASVSLISADTVEIKLDAGTPVTAGAAAFVRYGFDKVRGAVGGALSAVGAGAAYAHGTASTEFVVDGDVRAICNDMLKEGAFVIRQGAASAIIRDVRLGSGATAGKTILRGETPEVSGTFTTGTGAGNVERDRTWGNLCDTVSG